MMTIVRDCLQSQGYVVRCAETIEQMDLLLSHSLDLIISDIHVPDGNGLIHCIERKQAWSLNCPIIAITASEKHDVIDDVFSAGADDYIQKPFVTAELIARVRLHLNLSRQHQATLAILEDQPTGIVMIDQQGLVRYSNHRAREWLGTDNRDGKHWSKWLSLPERDRINLERALKDPQLLGQVFLSEYKTRTGTQYLEWSIRPSPIQTADRLVYLNNQTEITELKKHFQLSQRIIGNSPSTLSLMSNIQQLAQVDWNVLIEGETGTGKELVARTLHELSKRSQHPYIAINCAGLTESLLGDQLFGHEKGAYTGADLAHKGVFEEAEGGTLFLDEIGDLPMAMQGTLLRVLQERCITRLGSNKSIPVNVRLVFATHQNIPLMVKTGRFRGDLYYRINSASIQVPPLRERNQDIPLILQYWLQKDAHDSTLSPPSIEEGALYWLSQQRWPGNVRQIQQVVKRLILLNLSDIDLTTAQRAYGVDQEEEHPSLSQPTSLAQVTLNHEAQQIMDALQAVHGNKEAAAKRLGISRATLYRKLSKYQMSQF